MLRRYERTLSHRKDKFLSQIQVLPVSLRLFMNDWSIALKITVSVDPVGLVFIDYF